MTALERARALWRLATGKRLAELLVDEQAGPATVAGVLGLSAGQTAAPIAPGLSAGGAEAAAIAPGLSAKGPRGWLGALFAHGAETLSFQIMTIIDYHDLLPYLDAEWSNTDYECTTEYGPNTNCHQGRFEEWACPAFDGQSPTFINGKMGPMDSDEQPIDEANYRNALNQAAYAVNEGDDLWPIPERIGLDIRGREETFQTSSRTRLPIGSKPAKSVLEYMDWLDWACGDPDTDSYRPSYDNARDELKDLKNNKVKASAYWSGGDARKEEFEKRLMRWYWTAQFAVWSTDVLLSHSPIDGRPITGSGLWQGIPVDHVKSKQYLEWLRVCSAWGVPARHWTKYRTAHQYAHDSNLSKFKPFRNLGTTLTWEEWWKIAQRVMYYAKIPGQPGTLGEQIVDEGAPGRHIFDLPDALMWTPPYLIGGGTFNMFAAQSWLNAKKPGNFWTDTFMPIYDAVFSIVSAAVGGAAFNAFMDLAKTIYAVAVGAMQATVAITRGEEAAAVSLVTKLGECAALVGAAVGTNTAIPDDLWEQLKGVGEITGYSGELAEQLANKAAFVQGDIKLIQEQGYSYLDDLFGGIVAD